MTRKKDSPQKAVLREMMGNYLKENNAKIKDDINVNSTYHTWHDIDYPGRCTESGILILNLRL